MIWSISGTRVKWWKCYSIQEMKRKLLKIKSIEGLHKGIFKKEKKRAAHQKTDPECSLKNVNIVHKKKYLIKMIFDVERAIIY